MSGVAQKNLGSPNGSAQRVARPAGVPIRVTPTVLNSDAYDAGDVLFDVTELLAAIDVAGGSAVIDQIAIYDKGDQATANLTLVFSPTNATLGTKDAAPSITDANAAGAAAGQGVKPVVIASASFIDLGGIKIAIVSDLKLAINAADGATSLFLAAFTAGTPTQATGDIVIDIWVH